MDRINELFGFSKEDVSAIINGENSLGYDTECQEYDDEEVNNCIDKMNGYIIDLQDYYYSVFESSFNQLSDNQKRMVKQDYVSLISPPKGKSLRKYYKGA